VGSHTLHLYVFPVWSAYSRLLENVAENLIQFKNDLRKVWAERSAKTGAELNQKRASLALLMPSVAMVLSAVIELRMHQEDAKVRVASRIRRCDPASLVEEYQTFQ
jgi:hypothetical protein